MVDNYLEKPTDTIKSIDLALTTTVEIINKLATELVFEEAFQFVLAQSIPKEHWDAVVYPGVYLIEIKNDSKFSSFDLWLENFSSLWKDEKLKNRFVPGLKKKRIKNHTEMLDWIPLYIGKSKVIGARFFEHLYLDIMRNTFALKLYARSQFHDDTFRLSTIKLQVSNYDQIVPIVETALRNNLNPIIGKQ